MIGGVSELVADGSFELPDGKPFDAHGGASGYSMHTFGAVFIEMEVDEALGLARMRRCVAGYSAGRILNPCTARSQMIGGITWGYGRAMLEESVLDPRYGRYQSKNLSGVMLPDNADIPQDIDVFFIDEHDQRSSKMGARGIGEVGVTRGDHERHLPCDRQTHPQSPSSYRRPGDLTAVWPTDYRAVARLGFAMD